MKRNGSVRVWSVFGKAVVLIVLFGAAIDGRRRAVAQDSPAPPPPDPEPAEPWDGHIPNTLYPDGPAEIPITDLSPAEQAGINAIGERSNVGADVHAAWSSAVRSIAADAAVQRAAHQSGTTGFDGIGVEP